LKFEPLTLDGAYLITLQKHEDERGSFARTFCRDEFAELGLLTDFPQHNLSCNTKRGTVRGMHFQTHPHDEVKVVRCIKGCIDDCIIDLRENSPTYGKSLVVELSEKNGNALYIPEGFAHGFQSLEDDTHVLYLMGNVFVPNAASGIRWNDPAFDVSWRLPISSISQGDLNWPDFELNATK